MRGQLLEPSSVRDPGGLTIGSHEGGEPSAALSEQVGTVPRRIASVAFFEGPTDL